MPTNNSSSKEKWLYGMLQSNIFRKSKSFEKKSNSQGFAQRKNSKESKFR